VWLPVRTNGILGGAPELAWRWASTAEERLLAQARDEPAAPPSAPAAPATPPERPVVKVGEDPSRPGPAALPAAPTTPGNKPAAAAKNAEAATPDVTRMRAEWPGFRGPGRDSHVRGVRIETDWSKSPPVALWRRPIGPGWSSFAVNGDRLYTQEQRGNDEIVASYEVSTGKPVWMHRDAARFWESNGGAGPRGTPTLSNGRVYTLGATGILNALDADDGAVVWSRNAASDTGVKVPGWGFTSSPLVVGDVVIAATSGALVAYDRATGDKRWFVKSEGGSYSSPQLVTIGATPQVLLMGGAGATSVAPGDGAVLWKHAWPGSPIVQPAMLPDGDLLLSTADAMGGLGTRRIGIAHGAGGWTVEERWTSRGLKPYFNDFVVHKSHAFGFDGSILSCIDLADGERKWKGGRYGNGQLVLLPDQDLLLVLSEEGELALVSAATDKFTELARFPALEGKTWNHPAVVGEVLLVRNSQEMAAFRLPLASR
jgi:outer membrane protein assembly factor BamB